MLGIFGKELQLYTLIFQWDIRSPDPLLILKCVFLSHQLVKTINTKTEMMAQLNIRARSHLYSSSGQEFHTKFFSSDFIIFELATITFRRITNCL